MQSDNAEKTGQRKPESIIEKIWNAHVVAQYPGHPALLAVDLMLLHEVTSAQAFQVLQEKGCGIADRQRLLATIDHSIPTRENRHEIYDQAAAQQIALLRENCRRHDIEILDLDSGRQGIVHVVGPELGLTCPGMTIVCGDSHTSTHGAFGCLAFGIGSSEVAHVLASGCLLQYRPKTMKVEFTGHMPQGVYAKDVILYLISKIGIAGATGHVIEYCGPAIKAMTMEERMTLCNMSIECGARAGLVAPDQTTYRYLQDRRYTPNYPGWMEVISRWEQFKSDPDCSYDQVITVPLADLTPIVTWGTNPAQAISIEAKIPQPGEMAEEQKKSAALSLQYTGLQPGELIKGKPIEWAFLGSCTNGRIEDLRVAAAILAGRKIHRDVTMYVVPGSEAVAEQARQEGLDEIFLSAGAQFRQPGCSMCLGMNDDRVPSGRRCISSSNRNFVGRQGTGSITHLASPATVAASAIAGCITSPATYL